MDYLCDSCHGSDAFQFMIGEITNRVGSNLPLAQGCDQRPSWIFDQKERSTRQGQRTIGSHGPGQPVGFAVLSSSSCHNSLINTTLGLMKRSLLNRSVSPPALRPASKLLKVDDVLPPSVRASRTPDMQADMEHYTREEKSSVTGRSVKVVSWNCDGLDRYLSPSAGGIEKFFKTAKPKPEPKSGPQKDATEVDSFLSRFIKMHQPDVLCLQEVHFKRKEADALSARLKADAPLYKHYACLPYSDAGRRRSGTILLYRESAFPHPVALRTVDWDNEGRVAVLETHGLVLFAVYALNSTEYPYIDPITRRAQGTRADRKRHFDTLLASEMQSAVAAGRGVVAVGDFNVSRYPIDALHGHLRTHEPHATNRRHFNATFGGFRDIVRELYPEQDKFSWFSRTMGGADQVDKARVDLIFVSDAVAVDGADTLEDADRGQSDHCPLFVTVRLPA